MRFSITDNPGLVARSSENVGLGLAFLRHIERCSALVYVVDLSSADPVGALDSVRTELIEYAKMKGLGEGLVGKVRGVIANKADMFGETPAEEDEDPAARASAEDGKRKLAALTARVKDIESDEVEAGSRKGEDGIWVVAVSAKRRQNMAALVQRLADTVRVERRRAKELEEEEERALEQERMEALEQLQSARR